MNCLLDIVDLTKRFDKRTALSCVSATFRAGTITVIAGANGSGKTTLLRLLAGLIAPTSGEIRFSPEAPSMGLFLEQRHLYPLLTVGENLGLFAALAGADRRAVRQAIATFDLDACTDELVAHLSRGQKQRVALARALQAEPGLLLLDEPFVGLDKGNQAALHHELMRARTRGACVVVASPVPMADVEADQVVMLAEGKGPGA